MSGSYELTHEWIDKVAPQECPGNYALGRKNENGNFAVRYVGRSDDNVNDRLHKWVGETNNPLFKFSHAKSPKAAFERECVNYHDFNPPENEIHPDRPNGSNWKCPRCNVFDK